MNWRGPLNREPTDGRSSRRASPVSTLKAPAAARVSAASAILDRAFGRPPQDVGIKGSLDQKIIRLVQGLDDSAEPPDEASEDETPTRH